MKIHNFTTSALPLLDSKASSTPHLGQLMSGGTQKSKSVQVDYQC